jgi:hypothetical protein
MKFRWAALRGAVWWTLKVPLLLSHFTGAKLLLELSKDMLEKVGHGMVSVLTHSFTQQQNRGFSYTDRGMMNRDFSYGDRGHDNVHRNV